VGNAIELDQLNKNWELMSQTGEGFVILMDDAGNMRHDLKVPGGCDIGEYISDENEWSIITSFEYW